VAWCWDVSYYPINHPSDSVPSIHLQAQVMSNWSATAPSQTHSSLRLQAVVRLHMF